MNQLDTKQRVLQLYSTQWFAPALAHNPHFRQKICQMLGDDLFGTLARFLFRPVPKIQETIDQIKRCGIPPPSFCFFPFREPGHSCHEGLGALFSFHALHLLESGLTPPSTWFPFKFAPMRPLLWMLTNWTVCTSPSLASRSLSVCTSGGQGSDTSPHVSLTRNKRASF